MATPAPTASPSPPADIPPPTAPPPATPASPPPDIPLSPPPVSSPPPDLTPPPVISPPAPPVADPPPPIVTPPPEPPVLPPPSTPPPVPPALPPPSSSPPPESPVVPTPPTSTPVLPPPKSSSPPPPSSKLPPPKSPTEPLPPTAAPPPITPPPENPSTPPAPSGKSPPSTPGRTPTTPSLPSDSPPSPDSSSSSSISPAVVVGIAIAGVALVFILSFLFCCLKRKKRSLASPSPDAFPPPLPTGKEQAQTYQQNLPSPDDHVIKIHPSGITIKNTQKSSVPLGYTKSSFSYEDLVLATDGFSNANLLGQGGFGYVHRGVLPGGREVAVKQLKSGSGQGEREFQAEVEIISRVHHKHLVSLVGYSMADGKRLLVYEFVPNNTLEFHLHEKGRPTMDWPTRLRIALGSAKGLAYLHEDCHPKIIHRDIKAANILVDYNFEPKVSDFGLAKFASDGNTHISTRVIGTFGYLAPEYAATGKLTDKSDVFSFGVMLLELITGRRPVDLTNTLMDESLVDWARPLLATALEDGNFEALVDPKLQHDYNATELSRMAACAFAAVRHSAKRRPRMSQIVRALEGNASLEELIAGIQPGQSSIYASHSSSDYDDVQYKEDMKRFKILALTSEEFEAPAPNNGSSSGPGDRRDSVSSDCSAATSEYGQNPSGSSSEGSPSREIKSRTTKNISN